MCDKLNLRCIIIGVLIILIAVGGVKFFINYRKIDKLDSRISELNGKINSAREKNEELQKRLNNINDIEYIEKIARKKLGLVKPGEVLLIPVEERPNNRNN